MGGKVRPKIKKALKRSLRLVKGVRTWQLFLILIPLTFLGATLLRFDHLKMQELRGAVLLADEAGIEEDIESGLEELSQFTRSHIVVNIQENNGIQRITFGTGPFYLEQTYRRAANLAIEAAEGTMVDDSNPNGNIYAAVAAICQPQAIANGWAWYSQGYLDCWTSELAKYPASGDLSSTFISAAVPSTELYRREYASPVWAPTPAGFILLVCAILAVIIVVRLVIWLVLQLALGLTEVNIRFFKKSP